MSNAKDKLAHLSPEQKKLLAQKLKEKKQIHLFPLSYAQQRMWFLERLNPGSPVYNLPFAIRIKGALRKDIFEQALKKIIRRHEILRTTFKEIKGEVRQVVSPRSSIKIEISEVPPGDVRDRIRQLAQTAFDLEKGPLGLINLITVGPDDYVMILVMHHIISDGWSMGVLIREFSILYDALLNKREAGLPPLKIQYADYAGWQKKWLEGERLRQQLEYWRKTLGAAPPILELQGDKPRPRQLSSRGAQIYRKLTPAIWQRLKERAGREQLTDFMLLLGVFYLLLFRYTRQQDICIGTPVANRNRAETEPLIGFFVNTLVLRCAFDENDSGTTFFSRVRETALAAFAHQDIPFEMLVQELQPERDMSHSPLFQAFFTHTPASDLPVLPGPFTIEALEMEVNSAKFELSLFTQEADNGLNITFEYNSDLYSPAFVERIAGHFLLLLEQVSENALESISGTELLAGDEKEIILNRWNKTDRAYPGARPLLALFEEQVKKTPERTALSYEGKNITYGELNRAAESLAGHLQQRGVGPEDFVGLCLQRSPRLVIAMYAILKTGAAYVPLDPDYPGERIRYMIEDAGARVIISEEVLRNHPALNGQTVLLCDAIPESVPLHPVERDVDQVAYMIYTSGSTGKPKGVVISHRAIWNRLQWMQEKYVLSAEDRVLQKTPYSFDVSVWEFFWPLQCGATLVIAKPGGHKDPAYLQRLMSDEKVTTVHFVPSMLQAFLNSADIAACTALKRVICSGEALSRELARQFFRSATAELHNLYGPTEAAVDVTQWPCSDNDNYGSTPIGFPITNTKIYIVDNRLQLLPAGVAGELLIGGVQLARNYHNRPELTAEKFIPDPFSGRAGARLYRTGDLARFMENGAVEFLGRIDHQVKLRGLRIELGEIENSLKNMTAVADAVVLVKNFGADDQRLVAYVQLSADTDEETLRQALARDLPDYMVPALFVFMENIPLSPSGKVDRRALLAMDVTFQSEKEYVAPRGETEIELASIFGELLGVEKVGATDSFFELGGHSLLATRLVTQIRDRLDLEVPLRLIFETPSPRQLALAAGQNGGRRIELPLADRSGPIVLSHAQQRLWFLEQLEPGSPFYNIPMAFRLLGHVDVHLLQKSFQELIKRHETLRTAIITREGRGYQEVRGEVPFTLEVIDLREMEPAQREEEIARHMSLMARHTFDLTRPPLFRAWLLRASDEESILLGVVHHIISDQWSNQIILAELLEIYSALSRGISPALPVLERQYADFALWQRQWLDGGAMDSQLAYWKETLRGMPALLELPTDFPRPKTQSFNGAVHHFKLDAQTGRRLKEQGRKLNLTGFMQFMAYFGLLLHKLSGQDDLAIGAPVANRALAQTQKMVGFFVNTLVMRLRPIAETSLESYLGQVRQTVMSALEHQDIPFEKLVDELQPQRDMSHSPLFQVMFVYHEKADPSANASAPWRAEALSEHSGTAKFDLTLFITDTPQGFDAVFEYNTDLFEQDTIRRWAQYFGKIVQQAADDITTAVGRLSLLDEKARQQALSMGRAWESHNGPDTVFPRLFQATALGNAEAVALIENDETMSYGRLEAEANRMARALIRKGLRTETPVAIALPRGMDQILSLLAVLKAGGAWVPIDLAYPAERIRYMLEDAKVSFILCREQDKEKLPQTDIPQLTIAGLRAGALTEEDTPPAVNILPENLAYMIYTSGSTGKPKGTLLTHGGLMHYIDWCLRAYPLKAGGGVAVHATIAFDATITSVFAPLAAGVPLTLVPESPDMDAFINLLTAAPAPFALIKITPAHLGVLSQRIRPEQAAALCRSFIIGGENLTADRLHFWRKNAPETQLFNEYGPTETVVGCVVFDASHWQGNGSVPIGRPINGTPVYVLDEELNPVPPGVAGELYIGGPALARGYRNRADITAERFVPDPFSSRPGARMYRSGDKVRFLKDGQLIFLGRLDHQVKVRGYRIEPGEIEEALSSHPRIKACVVVTRGEPARLAAYYTLAGEGPEPAIAEIRSFLGGKLPDYMIPSAFTVLEALPLTPNGKIDLSALPDPGRERGALSSEYVAPSSENEIILAEIVSNLLKKEKVGIHDNFFELGGDSIMSIQVISRAREQGLFLTPMQMFQNQTIAQLALVAQKGRETETEEGILSGELPLTPIQHFFFEQNFRDRHHWNQSVLFRLGERLNSEALHKTVRALISRHDALRLRFKHSGEEWRAFYDDNDSIDDILEEITISGAEKEEIERHCREAQASFDLEKGPIVKVLYFRGEEADHLAIFVHHLAMDGVSWRILLQDFQQAYALASLDQEIVFGAKSSSYRQWARALAAFAGDKAPEDAPYWQAMSRREPPRLPVDFEGGSNLEKDREDITVSLEAGYSRLLTGEAHKAYNTEINDLLLSALIRAYGTWSGQRRILLHMESHGREHISDRLDVSHTIGWFTALYPLLLDLGKAVDIGEQIKTIKEQFHAIPHNGLSFGVLRYLSADKSRREVLKPLDRMQIIFNYLGQFEGGEDEGPFRESAYWQGPDHAPDAGRLAAVEINGQISAGILKFTFSYSRELHREETIRSWAENFIGELRGILEHCKNPRATVKTASDFKMAGLDNKKLDKVLNQLGKKKKGRRR